MFRVVYDYLETSKTYFYFEIKKTESIEMILRPNIFQANHFFY